MRFYCRKNASEPSWTLINKNVFTRRNMSKRFFSCASGAQIEKSSGKKSVGNKRAVWHEWLLSVHPYSQYRWKECCDRSSVRFRCLSCSVWSFNYSRVYFSTYRIATAHKMHLMKKWVWKFIESEMDKKLDNNETESYYRLRNDFEVNNERYFNEVVDLARMLSNKR